MSVIPKPAVSGPGWSPGSRPCLLCDLGDTGSSETGFLSLKWVWYCPVLRPIKQEIWVHVLKFQLFRGFTASPWMEELCSSLVLPPQLQHLVPVSFPWRLADHPSYMVIFLLWVPGIHLGHHTGPYNGAFLFGWCIDGISLSSHHPSTVFQLCQEASGGEADLSNWWEKKCVSFSEMLTFS